MTTKQCMHVSLFHILYEFQLGLLYLPVKIPNVRQSWYTSVHKLLRMSPQAPMALPTTATLRQPNALLRTEERSPTNQYIPQFREAIKAMLAL